MNNLINLPTINCITLERLVERQSLFVDQCKKYNLNYNFIYGYDDLKDSSGKNVEVTGHWINSMNVREISVTVSHIKAIRDWFFNSSDEYGFFCEDDLNLNTSLHWPFDWNYLVKNLPSDWLAIQLALIRDLKCENLQNHIKLHPYVWDNWSGCCYLISRKYAKIIIDFHVKGENSYNLNLPFFPETIPYSENVLYNASNKEGIYTIPLFVENISIKSSLYPDFIEVKNKNVQIESSTIIQDWWEKNGSKVDLNWFFSKAPQDS